MCRFYTVAIGNYVWKQNTRLASGVCGIKNRRKLVFQQLFGGGHNVVDCETKVFEEFWTWC